MKLFKKNQVIIYVITLMIMTAGYLNYTTSIDNKSIETSMQMESKDDTQLADIGDATLVNSNDIITGNEISSNTTNISESVTDENIIEDTLQTNSESNAVEDYFIKSKLERDTMYSQMIETYEKILNSSNSLETQKQIATQEISKINETKNSVMISENLIKTKGFNNCIVFVNSESINVIVETDEIKQEEVAQIQNIISREMKAEIENIHISSK